jgi:hypothetical protein
MKPIEFWIALIAGVLFVIERHKEKPLLSRILIGAISGGIGFSLAEEVSSMSGWGETVLVMVLTGLGYAILDIAASIFADRELAADAVKGFLRKWSGGAK